MSAVLAKFACLIRQSQTGAEVE